MASQINLTKDKTRGTLWLVEHKVKEDIYILGIGVPKQSEQSHLAARNRKLDIKFNQTSINSTLCMCLRDMH